MHCKINCHTSEPAFLIFTVEISYICVARNALFPSSPLTHTRTHARTHAHTHTHRHTHLGCIRCLAWPHVSKPSNRQIRDYVCAAWEICSGNTGFLHIVAFLIGPKINLKKLGNNEYMLANKVTYKATTCPTFSTGVPIEYSMSNLTSLC